VLRSAVSVGSNRTFHQDLGLRLRQLVDIALRALSPAVNDPTTAVQCLDRIVRFLADRPLGVVHHRDRHGAVRLVEDAPGWEDLVDLAFTELRGAAVAGPQVTRRMLAGSTTCFRSLPRNAGSRCCGTGRSSRTPWSTPRRSPPTAPSRWSPTGGASAGRAVGARGGSRRPRGGWALGAARPAGVAADLDPRQPAAMRQDSRP
jgi:hypothetical protein